MSLEIIKESKEVTKIEYSREFRWKKDRNSGCGFPCDKEGNLLPNINEVAKENYKKALNNDNLVDLGVVEREITYREPAIGKCSCECKNEMVNQYMGAFQCKRCGQWYNLFGQELKPVEEWNNYGELDYAY